MPSTLRFLRQFLRPGPDAVRVEEVGYRRGDRALEATLYRPSRDAGAASWPVWIALHGLTHRGRQHESLDGLARALAASGSLVLVPDIPEWRALAVAPAAAPATIRGATAAARDLVDADPDRIGVLGFSFGGTQALMAAADGELGAELAGVVSWGAYADFGRAVRFGFTGRHELDGERHALDPDPYGRWILAGNYLPRSPQLAGYHPAAEALHDLAREVGRRKILAWTPATDPLKDERRAGLAPDQRELFDLLAPPTDRAGLDARTAHQDRRLEELAERVAEAAVATDPLLDPGGTLGRVRVPVFLAHAESDRLIPWTELTRLRRALPDGQPRHAMVTGLFGHSFREGSALTPSAIADGFRFIRGMHRMINLV